MSSNFETMDQGSPDVVIEAARKVCLDLLLVILPLGSLLPPILLLLFLSGKGHIRRPIFWLNVVACLGGVIECCIASSILVRQVITPGAVSPMGVGVLAVLFVFFFPVIVDSILLARLFAFYPLKDTPRLKLAQIYTFPIAAKVARTVVFFLYLHQFVSQVGEALGVLQAIWYRNHYLIALWTLQMLDNLYSSSIFLCNIGMMYRWELRSQSGLLDILRACFVIALGNFFFPVLFNIIQLAYIVNKPIDSDGIRVCLLNNFVSILGVVFATIWSSARNWGQRPAPSEFTSSSANPMITTMDLALEEARKPSPTQSLSSSMQAQSGSLLDSLRDIVRIESPPFPEPQSRSPRYMKTASMAAIKGGMQRFHPIEIAVHQEVSQQTCRLPRSATHPRLYGDLSTANTLQGY